MNAVCVNSLYPRFRLRVASVMFDFNASLSDVASLSPMSLPVDLIKKREMIDFRWMQFVHFFSLHL